MYLLGKLLTKRRMGAFAAMFLMAVDCMHFTQTRIATIDSFVVLFIIWSYVFMVYYLRMDYWRKPLIKTLIPLALSGLFMGLAVASKWTGCYAGVGLAVLFFWSVWRRFREHLAASHELELYEASQQKVNHKLRKPHPEESKLAVPARTYPARLLTRMKKLLCMCLLVLLCLSGTAQGQRTLNEPVYLMVHGQLMEQLQVLHSGPRTELHEIIRQEYARHQDRAVPRNTLRQAVQGMLDTFAYQNFDAAAGEYTNRCCRPPRETEMRPWRLVTEIGWTGGGVLAYPLVLCRDALGADAEAPLAAAMSGEQLFDRIADAYNENSGLLNDLMAPNAAGSRVNGWWTGYGLVKDCHCAYTVGSAVHYLTKTMDYLHQNGKPCPAKWMDAAQKVLHTVMDLQRADGAFGYTYSTQERKVLDWSGFAGCWFAPALVYLYRLTGEERCLHSAEKALDYYHTFVKDLNCYGTPMDTWKAVDEEGNLAFMRGSRLLYEQTGKAEFLQYMKDSAGYEFLWRYGYKTYPEHTPLNQGWSACGGAVTSVSNPHIHPMGVIIDTDLRYLARVTGDGYYASRAADSAAWMLQCLELYPAATGYGRYGILSERWCPSDGLDVERFSDGRPFSSWFSHNLWASACVLEAACELLLEIEHKKG